MKSPGTEKTSVTPTWTNRRARWRPSVASQEAIAVAGWIGEVLFCFVHETTSLFGAFVISKDPNIVDILLCNEMNFLKYSFDGYLKYGFVMMC